MQTAFSEILVFLIRNSYSYKICVLGELQSSLIFPPVNNDLLLWKCSRVCMSKLFRMPRDAWDNDGGKSNVLAETGGSQWEPVEVAG